MFRLLADENFNGDIVRGLRLRQQDIDIVRVQDVGLAGAQDPDILAWAADNNRIVLTHDRATMTRHAYERLVAGNPVPGVFVLNDRFPVGQGIDEIMLVVGCTAQSEWTGLVVFLPL
jgi:hypothetical protein